MIKKRIADTFEKTLDTVEKTVDTVDKEAQMLMQPIHKTVFARFPILFTLLVTFGVSTTFLALEKLVIQISILNDHPLLMLAIGVGVLVLTGTLYKKL